MGLEIHKHAVNHVRQKINGTDAKNIDTVYKELENTIKHKNIEKWQRPRQVTQNYPRQFYASHVKKR